MNVCRMILLAAAILGAAVPALADVVDDIAARRSVNIGFRTDAAPFSFLDGTDRPAGFSVDLCLRIVDEIGRVTGKALAPVFVPVGTSDRFTSLADKTIDILCEPTTVTLKRRELVDFTLFTFVTGGTLMVNVKSGPLDLEAGKTAKIGVLTKTTSEAALQKLVSDKKLAVEIVPVDTHDVAIGFLTAGAIDGYFGDRDLLWNRKLQASDPSAFEISETLLTYEPYALAVPRGESRLRLISDRTLAQLYRSGEIARVVERWFPHGKPTSILKALYFIQSLEE